MGDFFWLVIIATSIWVLIDAQTIGVKKGQIQGMGNMGPWGWFFVCLLLWIIGFPFYLAKRQEFKRINAGSQEAGETAASKPTQEGTKPAQKGISIIGWIAIVFLGLFIIGMMIGPDKSTSTNPDSTFSADQSNAVTPATPEPPPLEVLSWRCDNEHGYIHVRGEVRNVSSRKLENVVAVGEFRTKDGELVKTGEALLDYNPIMPGQKSPFSAGGTDNPSIKNCQIAFKYLMGGSIPYTEK